MSKIHVHTFTGNYLMFLVLWVWTFKICLNCEKFYQAAHSNYNEEQQVKEERKRGGWYITGGWQPVHGEYRGGRSSAKSSLWFCDFWTLECMEAVCVLKWKRWLFVCKDSSNNVKEAKTVQTTQSRLRRCGVYEECAVCTKSSPAGAPCSPPK